MSQLLSLEQISERLGVPVATLRYWRHRGEGPRTFRVGRRVVAFSDDCDRWLADQAIGATATGAGGDAQ